MSSSPSTPQNSPSHGAVFHPARSDFQTLGIRNHEARVAIIRRAASHSGRVLADASLQQRTRQDSQFYARFITSAYRVMDPRRRPTTAERISLLRYDPNEPSFHSPVLPRNENLLCRAATTERSRSDDLRQQQSNAESDASAN
ncbi:MAG: hypothetical protein AAFP90_10510, partial [Planctomycetota bacterium]